jgi:diguanylate cyclase (GGDEF)-like protein
MRGRLRRHAISGTFVVTAVAALCVAVFALIGWNVWLARDASEMAASRSVENVADHAAREVEADIAAADAFLRGLIAVLPSDGPVGLSAAQYSVLAALAGEDGRLGTVAVLDTSGRPLHIIAASDRSDPGAISHWASAPWLAEAVRHPSRLIVGRPGNGLSEGQSVLPVARAVNGPGGVRAVVMAELLVGSLETSLSGLDFGGDGVVWLLSGGETVVVRLPGTEDARKGLRSLGAARADGDVAVRSRPPMELASIFDDSTRLHAVRAVADLPLTVAVSIGADRPDAVWQRQATASLAFTAMLCSAMFGIAVLLRREIARRNSTEQDLWLLSETDDLTGLANRRRFERVIDIEMRRARRSRAPLSVLIIDIDRFKLINDQYGHATGDEVLQAVAARLLAAIRRPADLAARVGGDEFAVLLPETDAKGAEAVAETARATVEASALPEIGVTTITIGIATCESVGTNAPLDLIAAADRALYAAKEAGRNRIGHWAAIRQ